MTRPMFYQVYPMEHYTDNKNVLQLTAWEFTSAIHYINSELKSLTRPNTIKSVKLLDKYINDLETIRIAFNNIYNEMFNRTSQYTDNDIVNIHEEYLNNFKVISDLIKDSKKQLQVV